MYVLARSGVKHGAVRVRCERQLHRHPSHAGRRVDRPGADQCTFWIAGDGAIRRYDVCTGTPLPDFRIGSAGAVRVLPDGGALVLDGGVRRYSAAGTLAALGASHVHSVPTLSPALSLT